MRQHWDCICSFRRYFIVFQNFLSAVLSSLKKAFLASRSMVTVLLLAVLYCLMSLGKPCFFCLPVQVVAFSHKFFNNHGWFCLFGTVPFGILTFIMCINCCSQFCKDTLISLIGACQLVLSIKSQTLLKSASAYLHMGLGWDHTCCLFDFHLSWRSIPLWSQSPIGGSSCLHDYIEIEYAWTFTPQKLATTCLSAAGWKFLHIEAMQQPRNHIKCRKLVLTSISIISKSSQPLHALHGTAIAFCSQERCMVFRSIDTCHDLQLHALQV